MKPGLALSLLLTLLCLILLGATWSKGRQLADLREKQQTLLSQFSATPDISTPPAITPAETAPAPNSSELLKLRNEINRLTQRKKELAAAHPENQRLRAQLASIGTNNPATLSADYVRKSTAQNRGYTTPQNTLETFLWAAQNKDLTNFLEAFTAETASLMQQSIQTSGRSLDDFFRDADKMPGFRVVKTEQPLPDQVKLLLEFVPGIEPQPMVLKQVNGQWKMMMPR